MTGRILRCRHLFIFGCDFVPPAKVCLTSGDTLTFYCLGWSQVSTCVPHLYRSDVIISLSPPVVRRNCWDLPTGGIGSFLRIPSMRAQVRWRALTLFSGPHVSSSRPMRLTRVYTSTRTANYYYRYTISTLIKKGTYI